MSKTKSVVKHRYFKGEQAQRGVGDYTRYVEYRDGKDREQGGREFFTGDRENIKGSEVRGLWREQSGRGPVMHELIMSPGLNGVDQQEYTRELMERLEKTKGQELQWYAVEHKNTDHHHIHVLIAGRDAEGRQVRIDRNDHKQIKEWGDRYIEREHQLDRYLDREIDRLVTGKEYTRDRGDDLFDSLFGKDHQDQERGKKEPDRAIDRQKEDREREPERPKEWDKARSIAELPDQEKIHRSNETFSKYSSLDELKRLEEGLEKWHIERVSKPEYAQLKKWISEKERYGEDYHDNKERSKFEKTERDKQGKRDRKLEKEREKQKARDAGREFNDLDKKYREAFQQRASGVIHRDMGRKQRIFEARGKLGDHHYIYQVNQDRQRLKDSMERDAGNREQYQKELDWLNDATRQHVNEFLERIDLDDLLGGKDREKEPDRSDKKDKERIEERDGKEQTDGPSRQAEEVKTQCQEASTNTEENTTSQSTEDKEREQREQKEAREQQERERDRDDEGRGR